MTNIENIKIEQQTILAKLAILFDKSGILTHEVEYDDLFAEYQSLIPNNDIETNMEFSDRLAEYSKTVIFELTNEYVDALNVSRDCNKIVKEFLNRKHKYPLPLFITNAVVLDPVDIVDIFEYRHYIKNIVDYIIYYEVLEFVKDNTVETEPTPTKPKQSGNVFSFPA